MKIELEQLIEQQEYSKVLMEIENNPNQLEPNDVILFQAKCFYGLEFFQRAKEMLESLVKFEQNDEALLLLTEIYLQENNSNMVQNTYEKIDKTNVDSQNYLIISARVLNIQGEYDEALELVNGLLQQDVNHYELKKEKIELLINKKEPLDMILSEIKALRKIRKNEIIDYLTGKAYLAHGDYEKTNKQINKITRKNPNSKYVMLLNEMMKNKVVKVKVTSNSNENLELRINKSEDDISLKQALDKLEQFIGLQSVKTEVLKIVNVVQHEITRRKELGIEEETADSYHFMFYGNPGTGKTTVARILGDIFFALGILEKPDVVEVDRSDLVGEHIGETAVKTKKVIESAMGGILFVDEAYTLAKGESSNDFGTEAIDTLLKAMEDNRDKFIVILAGYEDRMVSLLQMNEGLESRINKKVRFDDYNEEELLKIARMFAEKKYYTLTEEAEKAFLMKIESEQVKSNFSNARAVRNLIDEATQNRALRLNNSKVTKEQLKILEPVDFEIDINKMFSDDLDDLLKELDEFVGLASVKREIKRIINNIKANQKRAEAGIKVQQHSFHMVFYGNPGTGKTMFARFIGKLFKSLGILKRGQLIEVSREDFVGQYIGHTAPKTKHKIQEAYGGVLFIDEAYSLNSGGENDFGKEAIDVLIQEMENKRDKLVVIMAGYTEDMQNLFKLNKGLESRIVYNFEFADYTSEEITDILYKIAHKDGYILEDGCYNIIERTVHKIKISSPDSNGNGRLARNLFGELTRIQGDRLVENEDDNPIEIKCVDAEVLRASY